MIPRATYRLQFGPDFGFADAAALAPYLAALGISHVYLAPVFAARPGSTHGYDVTDPSAFNEELGGEPGFRAMAAAFRGEGLAILLDIVPNHMGIGGDSNRFWLDVLARGQESPYARWFDIDWKAGGGKVVLPVLGEPYRAALTAGALELRQAEDGSLAVWAHATHALPVAPEDREAVLAAGLGAFRGRPGEPASWASLGSLIARQHWRAAKFTLDRDGLNYRRFFAISDLAGVRVEDAAVFEATHALALSLIADGLVDGLRIDHVDGLRDPAGYVRRLRARTGPIWILVEKILAPEERLPDWGADGTTGYEVANLLAGLLVDPAGEAPLDAAYRAFTGRDTAPAAVVRAAKREVLARMLGSEVEAVVRRLRHLADTTPRFADLGTGAIRVALVETVAAMGVYRTYADGDGMGTVDRARVRDAVAEAARAVPWLEPDAFGLVAAVLTLDCEAWPGHEPAVAEAAFRVQQLTGPTMAKGLEDTALYRYGRLIALNEVGSEPGRFATGVEAFHRANAERLEHWPRAMLATSTHDTKRGEDVRARIAVLAHRAEAWAAAVEGWHPLVADPARPIDPNDAWFFYQLLLGAWPMAWRPGVEPGGAAFADFAERVKAAMVKSVREAGENTRWVFGDADYEARLEAFVDRALDTRGDFLRAFRAFEAEVAAEGAANGLVQAALKLTAPGVPDVYRGAEVWEQSLVDPDNRRPVAFDALARRLAALPAGAGAFADPTGADAKLAVTVRLLALRSITPDLFASGSYEPIAAGPGICAFRRRHGAADMLVVTRLAWAAGDVSLPEGSWREVLTETDGAAGVVPAAPVAVFVRGLS